MLRPGSAPSAIAKANGVHVSVRSNLGLGVRGCTDPFLRSIYVAPYSHQPRAEWVIGHELAELEIPEHLGDDHEHVCQAIAARLMMPTREFFDSGSSCDWDLAVLRQWWPHCSWQAMARRVAEVAPGMAAAAWEGSRAKFHAIAPGVEVPSDLDALEQFVAAEAAFTKRHSVVREGGFEARAWWTGGRRAVTLCRAG